MEGEWKLKAGIAGIILVTLILSGMGLMIVQYYVGYAVLQGEGGTITKMNIADVRLANYWHGFFGVAVMVQEFDYQQKYEIDEYGIDIYNLLFPCLESGESHEVYAALTPDINWETIGPANPEYFDNYFDIAHLQSASYAFTDNITIELGNRNITGIPATYLFVNSSSQKEKFAQGLLQDGNGNPIIVTNVEGFTAGFTGDVINYQLMVPAWPDLETMYYFFTDPFDTCPEGFGQLEPPGNVTGVVTDATNGNPIAYARVVVAGGIAVTGANGTYMMAVQGGTWKAIAMANNYFNKVLNVTIYSGKTTILNIPLEREAEVSESTRTSSGSGSGVGPGQSVGPGIGPYLEEPKKTEGIDHFITTQKIDRTLRMGQFYEDEIFIFNYGSKAVELDIEVAGNVSDVIGIDKEKLYVKPDSHESFMVTVFGKGAPGKYNGSIKLYGTFDDEIPVELLLTTKEKLPIEALLLDVIPLTPKIFRGGQLKFKTDLRNLLTDLRYNVSLSYYLMNPRENGSYYLGSDFKPLKTSLSLIKNYNLPKNLTLGDHILNIRAEYLNITTEANTVVTLGDPFYKKKIFGVIPAWVIGLFIGLIGVGAFLLWFVKKKLEDKKRYHLKVSMKTLPQKGPARNVYMGKIAETNKATYFDLNKLTTHAIVAGSTGGGKTISAQVLVEECLKNNIAVVVFDPTAQWSGYLRKCEAESMLKLYPDYGLKREDARAFDGNIRQIQDAREKIHLKKFFKPGEIQVFTIDKLDPKDIDLFVTNTVREVFHEHFDEEPELKYLMVYDEVHRLLPRFGGSGEGFIQIERACREFRKWGIGVLLVSQVLTDFASQIKANINSEIQMRTRDEGDLKRIATKYGKEVLRSLVKAQVGTGMLENPAWNMGKPYFVQFRPILHSVHRLTDEELAKYNKYNEIIDDMEFQIAQLKKLEEDVFDLELELKLALDKVKSGNFNMVDIYLEGIKPEIEKRWTKIGKKPEHKQIELVDLSEIEQAVEQARSEREKYMKDNKKEEKSAPKVKEQTIFEKTIDVDKAINFDNGATVMNLVELCDVLESMDDETYARYVTEEKNDIADWIKSTFNAPELAEKLIGKTKNEAIEQLKMAKIESEKKNKGTAPTDELEEGSEDDEDDLFGSDGLDTSKLSLKSEVRSPKSEVRSQKSEVRSQKSEVKSQESRVWSQESGVRSLESGVEDNPKESPIKQAAETEEHKEEIAEQIAELTQKSEVQSPKSEVQSQKSEVQSPKSEVQSQKSKVQSPKSEVQSQKSKVQSQKLEVEDSPNPKPQTPEQLEVQSQKLEVEDSPDSRLQTPDSKEPFYLKNGSTLGDLKELLGALKFMDQKLYEGHVSSENNDFANWVEHGLSNKKLAKQIRGVRSKSELIMVLEGAA